jgi:transcriptional regulator with XRE-family HTH domain
VDRIVTLTMSTVTNNAALPVRFDVQLMAEDMTAKGWTKLDFATKAGVTDMTVIRFLRGERQTAPTAKKLAKALGYSIRRYLISVREQASA